MATRRLQLNAFKNEARKGSTGRCVISKGLGCEVAKAEGELAGDRRLQFTISTGNVDRDNDIVNPKGATNLKTFAKTGVVLWAHDARLPPIAKPIKAWVEDESIKAIAEFQPADMDHPLGRGFGATVQRYFEEGFMKSVSIGFIPDEWEWAQERADEGVMSTGINFNRWELLEFSPVPVPANREAVVDLAAKGVDMRGVYEWATRCLDGEGELLVPRRLVEDAREGLRELYEPQTTFDFGSDSWTIRAGTSTTADAIEVAAPDAPADEPVEPANEDAEGDAPADEPVEPAEGDAPADEPVEPAEGDAPAEGEPTDAPAPDGEPSEPAKAPKVEVKRGRVLSRKNENDLKTARDLIVGVVEQVASSDEDDEPKSLVDQLEALAAEGPVDKATADRIVRAAAEISHATGGTTIEDLNASDVAELIREVARDVAVKAWKKHSGELP